MVDGFKGTAFSRKNSADTHMKSQETVTVRTRPAQVQARQNTQHEEKNMGPKSHP